MIVEPTSHLAILGTSWGLPGGIARHARQGGKASCFELVRAALQLNRVMAHHVLQVKGCMQIWMALC